MTRWRLDGMRALVTGGTKGIGAAVVDELRGLGATVRTVARQGADHNADLSVSGEAKRVVDEAVDALGGLDLLVNNAGTNTRKPSVQYTEPEVQFLFDTNVRSAWEMACAAHPALKESRGSIVQVGSTAGEVYVGSGAPYAMTKAALDQLTRYLAVEWARDGIRVNSVNPWYTETPLAAPILADPTWGEPILKAIPLGRVGQPEDVAAAVAFLLMPAARHITGVCVPVDGGFLACGFQRPIV